MMGAGVLTIDLGALAHNYTYLNAQTPDSCETAAVVKANGYGCGITPIAKTLFAAGAETFFTATLDEAIALRAILGKAPMIAKFGGFNAPETQHYKTHAITPVLNTHPDIENYQAADTGLPPAILHIDTGMNRLGIRPEEAPHYSGLKPAIIMSHFASADDPKSALTRMQHDRFIRAAVNFPKAKKSLANSAGIFAHSDYHLDMTRPGMGLFGLNPTPHKNNPMRGVVKLELPILQIRIAQKGESCGYNETYHFEAETPLAVVAGGYADGLLRSLSNCGALYWKSYRCPIRGRVSMDTIIVDLSAIPESERPAQWDMMEVIGQNQCADALAKDAGTIGYEILTALGTRYRRIYLD